VKGRVVVIDHIDGREAAALVVDGRLEDLLIDPAEDPAMGPGAICRAVADRLVKGQAGCSCGSPAG
jgi:ribonuclease G